MREEQLFKAFADESRLKIVASLLESPKFVEQLAAQLNISVSTASFHLKKLEAAGVVHTVKQQYYQVYYIEKDLINRSLVSLLPRAPENDCDAAFADGVRAEFVVGGRVKKLPVQVKKREVIYRMIAEKFTAGKKYSVGEASVIIADITDEFVTARDEMIEMGILTERGGGIYLSAPDKIKK